MIGSRGDKVDITSGEERAFDALLTYIRNERGLDYSQYKQTFLHRRFAVRMRACNVDSYLAYLSLLRRDAKEFDALLGALSVNLSYFFRDKAAFDALRYGVLTPFVARQAQAEHKRIAIWSAGCAGGEEPYSVAMALADLLKSALQEWDIRIHATDIDPVALANARQGRYRAASFQDTNASFILRYFSQRNRVYELNPFIRQMVSFHLHSVNDPPFLPQYDLILCRNLLIYFTREHQQEIVTHLLSCLAPGGYLMLGMAEMLPLALVSWVDAVDGRLRIYRKSIIQEGNVA